MEKECHRAQSAADASSKDEAKAKAQMVQMQEQLAAAQTAHKQTIQDLNKCRRESQAVKAATRQARLSDERSLARQRERFTEATIAAARNGSCSSVIAESVFNPESVLHSSVNQSLHRQELTRTEEERSILAANNSTLRRLFADSLNVFRNLLLEVASIQSLKELDTIGAPLLQSDLFRDQAPLQRVYSLDQGRSAHPAVSALSNLRKVGEHVVYEIERLQRSSKDGAQSCLSGQVGARLEPARNDYVALSGSAQVRYPPVIPALSQASEQACRGANSRAHLEMFAGPKRESQLLKDNATGSSRTPASGTEVTRHPDRKAHAERELVSPNALLPEPSSSTRPSTAEPSDTSVAALLQPLSANGKSRAARLPLTFSTVPFAEKLSAEDDSAWSLSRASSCSQSGADISQKRTRSEEDTHDDVRGAESSGSQCVADGADRPPGAGSPPTSEVEANDAGVYASHTELSTKRPRLGSSAGSRSEPRSEPKAVGNGGTKKGPSTTSLPNSEQVASGRRVVSAPRDRPPLATQHKAPQTLRAPTAAAAAAGQKRTAISSGGSRGAGAARTTSTTDPGSDTAAKSAKVSSRTGPFLAKPQQTLRAASSNTVPRSSR
ncbi:unnamed protein product [Parajaminaea phylloscopi]